MNNVQNDSLVKKHLQQNNKQRTNSKTHIYESDNGNIPLMPLMSLSEGQMNPNRSSFNQDHISNSERIYQQPHYTFDENAGNIPLLDLSDENYFFKNKKKNKTLIKK